MKEKIFKKKNVMRGWLTSKLYDKIIKMSSKYHETIPLKLSVEGMTECIVQYNSKN
jgi:hypothetical protein